MVIDVMVIVEKSECRGCSACQAICPTGAVSMQMDSEGFIYPSVEQNLCISCMKCKNVCPALGERDEHRPNSYHGGIAKDTGVRNNSSSGGASYALAKEILQNGGVVFGASFKDDFSIVHAEITALEQYKRIQGSKYVQSDIQEVYLPLERHLKEGRTALFIGTPCQCDAVKHFVANKRLQDNSLILCDLVCHGVPSPGIWLDYIKMIDPKGSLVDFRFRDKSRGWHGDNICAVYSNKTIRNTAKLKVFTQLYFRGLISRPCCETCKYANLNRVSDITIGDFWGIEKLNVEINDGKGISLLIVNTEKGEKYLNMLSTHMELFECKECDCMQEQLIHPAHFSPLRQVFWNDYNQHGFSEVAKCYGGLNATNRAIRRLKETVKTILLKCRKSH